MSSALRVNIRDTTMTTEPTEPRRPYRKRRRADQEAATRQRITEAAVELHGTIGPARTTIRAIAERAGVQRATVYRHFADMEAVFEACSAHWRGLNPPPDPEAWLAIAQPGDRLLRGLEELYAWYEWGEPMLTNVRRDGPLVPASAAAGARFEAHFASLAAALMEGRSLRGRRRSVVAGAIGHALAFSTWRSLAVEQGLARREAIELVVAMVRTAETSTPGR